MSRRPHRLKLLVAASLGAALLATPTCSTRKFADSIATNAARDLANVLIDALVIDPIDAAVNPED